MSHELARSQWKKRNYLMGLELWTVYYYHLQFNHEGRQVLMDSALALANHSFYDVMLDCDPYGVMYVSGRMDGYAFTMSEFGTVVMGRQNGPIREEILWVKFCEYHSIIKHVL
jgi:hypothetical protein